MTTEAARKMIATPDIGSGQSREEEERSKLLQSELDGYKQNLPDFERSREAILGYLAKHHPFNKEQGDEHLAAIHFSPDQKIGNRPLAYYQAPVSEVLGFRHTLVERLYAYLLDHNDRGKYRPKPEGGGDMVVNFSLKDMESIFGKLAKDYLAALVAESKIVLPVLGKKLMSRDSGFWDDNFKEEMGIEFALPSAQAESTGRRVLIFPKSAQLGAKGIEHPRARKKAA